MAVLKDTASKSACFICGAEIPDSPRYPVRVCGDCHPKAMNDKGEKLSFYNESASGGFLSFNHTTQAYGQEHTCFLKGYECKADEAYMGGIVIVPTEAAQIRKAEKQARKKKADRQAARLSVMLFPLLLGAAYAISRGAFMDSSRFTLVDLFIGGSTICLLVLVFLLMGNNVPLLAVVGLSLTTLGLYIAYYLDYKGDPFFSDTGILATSCAYIVFTVLLQQIAYIRKKMKSVQTKGPRGAELWLLWFAVPFIGLLGGYIWLNELGKQRVSAILETQATRRTTALVIRTKQYDMYLPSRHRYGTRGRSRHNDALLEYHVDGKTFYRNWENEGTKHLQGDRLEIKYVVGQPDMFKIIAPVGDRARF